jgi:hypothetical protein
MTQRIIQALAVSYEIMGQTMSETALEVMAKKLNKYPERAVLRAIDKAISEVNYLKPADIISRIDDGRPSPEKAWQEVQHLTEDDAKVLTTEQNQAFCMVSTSLIDGDTSARITAKQTFISEYKKLCEESRDAGQPVQYYLARANRDYEGAKALEAVTHAVSENKIPQVEAARLLPQYEAEILQLPVYRDDEAAGMIEDMAKAIGR